MCNLQSNFIRPEPNSHEDKKNAKQKQQNRRYRGLSQTNGIKKAQNFVVWGLQCPSLNPSALSSYR